ncbi:MAG: 2Fe-2S iron-sulfur cluster binding domain-containing protein [Merismopedia sp. SIO2A8]|nr:2Fe-2S iron-sulfur cluster binding domain-containing protein [Merismopedia sp. SIO2A8]
MADTYTVEIHHQGKAHTIAVQADEYILQAALDEGLDLPYSCNAGVCTTCSAKVLDGAVDQSDAAGIGPTTQAAGYALLCHAKPTSDLKIETEKEEEVYQLQFGGNN